MNNGERDNNIIEFDELEASYRAMMDETAAMQRLSSRVEHLITQAAFAEFPSLKNMSPEDFLKFDDRRSRTAMDFALHISKFAFRAQRES